MKARLGAGVAAPEGGALTREVVHDYRVRPPAPLTEVARLVDELRVHPLLAAAVWSRGLREDAAARLAPRLERAPIPALVPAAERLAQAIERRERIVLHGDYDADGVTATALLTLGLRALGASVSPFVPDRLVEGYGIHPDRVAAHAAAAELFVTVDCGIGDLLEVAALRAAGVDVIVTDHHLAGDDRPDALVVHPHDGVGTADLTGAGVAFHLLWALHEQLGLEPPLALADLAAIGTIADVAPLLGPNRALVRVGLERLAASERPGLRALVGLTKLRAPLTARHVAFVLGPRLNAAGRMGRADVALELLLTADERRGRVLATLLEGMNQERKGLQERMLEQALALADDAPALVLRHPDWHPGLMGIVASQVSERCHKPVFVVARGKGSVRSVAGISAVAALGAARAHLTRWGGHALAAGFSLDEERFDAFRDAICAHVAAIGVPPISVTADAILHPSQVDADLHRGLQALEPYGQGHEEPLFALAGQLEQVRAMGRNKAHVQATMQGVRAVGWSMGHVAAGWRSGEHGVTLATVASSTWQDRTTIELHLRNVARSGSLRLATSERPGAADYAVHGHGGRQRAPAAELRLGPVAAGERAARVVQAIEPTDDDPLAPLAAALRAGGVVHLDLGPAGPATLRRLAGEYPRVGDAREAFVYSMRGRPWPWHGALAERLRKVLHELDLLDERGRARAGRRVEPFDAPTLRVAMVARHALESLASLLEALPPDDAATAVRLLLAPATD